MLSQAQLQIWQINFGLILFVNCLIIMGLKLRWFRTRMHFGDTPHTKPDNVTGIGFKQMQNMDLPTYTQISEFSTVPPNYQSGARPKTTVEKRYQNPEVALKVQTMLSRSLSNVHETEKNHRNPTVHKSTEDITINKYDKPVMPQRTVNNSKPSEEHIYKSEQQNIAPAVPARDFHEYKKEEIIIPSIPKRIAPLPKVPDVVISNKDEISFQQPNETTTSKSILKKVPTDDNLLLSTPTEHTKSEITQSKLILDDDQTSYRSDSTTNSLPPVNFATLPPKTHRKHWDNLMNLNDEEPDSNFGFEPQYAEIQPKKKDFDPQYDEIKPKGEKSAYVISIDEGLDNINEAEYAVVKRKQKRSIQFEDDVSIINEDSDDLYQDIVQTIHKREKQRLSESSISTDKSSEVDDNTNEGYGNDYANTKRTSYFQAGSSTYSSQAASIFFGNKKPVAERRPTQFIRRESSESQTSV